MEDIFISYSSSDTKMTDIILKHHLQNYQTWSMKDGRVGDDYIKKIDEKLKNCSSAILILTPEFFRSEFICNVELPALLKRNEDDNFKLMPILLSKCSDEDLEKIGTINVFPSRNRPMSRFDSEEWNYYMEKFKTENLGQLDANSQKNKNIEWKDLTKQFNQKTLVPNPMRGERGLTLVAGPNKRLELFIPILNEKIDFELNISSFETRVEERDDGSYFVITMEKDYLLEFFYTFCCYLDDEFTSTNKSLGSVIKDVTKKWKELTKEQRSIKELEKGLLGELWFLSNLVENFGQNYIKYWRGFGGDRHDFRIKDSEFEIKTTSSDTRQHYISSINQLEPSLDCNLSLISIQIAPTKSEKNSISVVKLINKIESGLTHFNLSLFHSNLIEYVSEEINFIKKLNTKYVFSSTPMIINVDENFPKISNQEFLKLKYHERISDLKYRLNVEGIGQSISNQEFQKVIKDKL